MAQLLALWRTVRITAVCLVIAITLRAARLSAQDTGRATIPRPAPVRIADPALENAEVLPEIYDGQSYARYDEPPPPLDNWNPTWMPCQSLRYNRSLVLGHLWFGMDIMGWATKGVQTPALVTTSPVGTDILDAGVLGAANTTTLFGNEFIHNEMRPGGKLTIGWWFDVDQYTGIEWHYLELDGKNIRFEADETTGNGILARPIFDIDAGTNASVPVAFPGVLDGSIRVLSNLQLTSTGIVFRDLLWGSPIARVDYLVGYRHAHLHDNLKVREGLVSLDDSSGFTADDVIRREDEFRAVNQFDGADLGLKFWWSRNRKLAITGLAKIAVGAANQNVIIEGFTSVNSGGTITTTEGGVLAQASNIGRRANQEFGIVSEMGLGLEWTPGCQWHFNLGYTWLYWSDVARAMNQVDTTVNASGTRPAFNLQTTSFWAQGLTAGFSYQF